MPMFNLVEYIKSFVYRQYISRYDYGNQVNELLPILKGFTMSTPIDIVTLYELCVHLNKHQIEGSFVECGVWKGGSAAVMASANLFSERGDRKIHLFDLFDDIIAPDPKLDGEKAVQDINRLLKKQGKTLNDFTENNIPISGVYNDFGGAGSVGIVEQLLCDTLKYKKENVVFNVGLFEKTIPNNNVDKIALLRLDGDWYSSIKVCLDHLYDKVVPNGVIIIDDYWTYEGCKKAVDDFFEERNLKYFKSYSRPQTRYFFKV